MKKKSILFLLLALGACGGDDKPKLSTEDVSPKPVIKTDNLICPQVAILQQAQEVFDYGGEKASPSQLVSKARLKRISGDCAYRLGDEDGAGSGIDISFELEAVAARGPRLGGSQIGFPYFVAVIDPAENILSRQVMTAKFEFSGKDQMTQIEEPLHIFIPMPKTSLESGPDYRVLLGFELPKAIN